MRGSFSLILLCALLTPKEALSQDHTLFISPLISYDRFRTPGFDGGIDFGAGAGVRITPSISVSASAAFGQRTVTYDVIGGSQAESAKLVTLGGSIEFLLLGDQAGAGIAATLGGGWLSGTFDAQKISLGALGSVTIPEHSISRGFVETGVAGRVPLSASVAVVILPSLRLFSPFSTSPDFSIGGGLRVGIF
jgi:hypothetical protein